MAGLQFEGNGFSGKIQEPDLPGTAVEQIGALARAAGVEHSIDNGTLAIEPASGSRQGEPTVISPPSGLVSNPMFESQGGIFRTL